MIKERTHVFGVKGQSHANIISIDVFHSFIVIDTVSLRNTI